MPTTSLVKWIGLPKLLKKLDANLSIGPESQALLGSVGGMGQTYLVGLMPGHWERPRQVDLQSSANSARLSMPRYPYIFFERGSQASGGGGRAHVRKTAAQFKAQGAYRIRPRRYLARTKAFISRELKKQITELKQRVERTWAA